MSYKSIEELNFEYLYELEKLKMLIIRNSNNEFLYENIIHALELTLGGKLTSLIFSLEDITDFSNWGIRQYLLRNSSPVYGSKYAERVTLGKLKSFNKRCGI